MLLRKIDGEKNVQNCGFSAKLRNGDGGDMLHDQRQRQLSRTRTVIFRWYDTSPTSKSRRRWPGNPNGRSKVRKNLRLFTLTRLQLTFRRRLRGRQQRLTAVADSGFQRPLKRHVAVVKQIVGNDETTLMVDRNSAICLFTLGRSQLTLRRRLHCWRRLTEIFQTAGCRRQKHRRRRPGDDQDQSNFCNYQNLCLRDQAKPLEKYLLLLGCRYYDGITHCFFTYYHSQRLLFSRTKNNISTTLTPPKNRDIHIGEFYL